MGFTQYRHGTSLAVNFTHVINLHKPFAYLSHRRRVWGNEGLEPPQRFYKGGSAPAEILPYLIVVTILANPETLDVAKKTKIICIRGQSFNKIVICNLYMLSGGLSW